MTRTPTAQQAACIEALKAHEMLKISACAGAGKTSVLTMMAEAVQVPSLYLAFNKVTAGEASEKFPRHVTCKTTHSVAYAACGTNISDKLSRPKGRYVNVAGTGSEIAKHYGIDSIELEDEIFFSSTFIGLLTKLAVAKFEQSADTEITIKHLPAGDIFEKIRKKPRTDTTEVGKAVLLYATKLWKERINPRSKVLATHDTYLKMFQLSKPTLKGYDVLYVDEAADSTPCVLDIVMSQKGQMKIVLVGDARQAIYSWRGAINAMELVACEERFLSKSFRFGQPVADIATLVLENDIEITGNENITSVVGRGKVNREKPYTRLFRTNAALLAAAIEEINMGTEVSIHVDTRDFVKLLESALALASGQYKQVKHDKIVPYTKWEDLKEEAKHDAELGRVAKIVAGGEARQWIDTLQHHVNSSEPLVTFVTAHKSKGLQWPQVVLEDDFKSNYNDEKEWVGLTTEEQNLLYVACTRAEFVLDYNKPIIEYMDRAQWREGELRDALDSILDREVGDLIRDVREAMAA